VHGQLNVIF